MSDLVERLKEPASNSPYWVCRMKVERGEAAAEIARLRADLALVTKERDSALHWRHNFREQDEAAELCAALDKMARRFGARFIPDQQKVAAYVAALTAAAEAGRGCKCLHVSRHGHQDDCELADPAMRDFIKDTPYSEPNDGWAAEQTKPTQAQIEAADDPYGQGFKEGEFATIERCAQVARASIIKNWGICPVPSALADAVDTDLRALKEQDELESGVLLTRAINEVIAEDKDKP